MSRYAVNKVLWQVARNDVHAASFIDAPAAFLAGRPLTETEREQLLTRDFSGMFAAGAHPFLLYTFTIKVSGGWSFPLMGEYIRSLGAVDPPLDIST